MDQFRRNFRPHRRFFYAQNESGKIFGRNDPQNFWKTPEAGAEKEIFLSFWLLWSHNLGTSEQEKDKKSMSKLNDLTSGAIKMSICWSI